MKGGKYQFTGDYIMSTLNTKQALRVHPSGKYTRDQPTGDQVGRSDHEPVIVQLVKSNADSTTNFGSQEQQRDKSIGVRRYID